MDRFQNISDLLKGNGVQDSSQWAEDMAPTELIRPTCIQFERTIVLYSSSKIPIASGTFVIIQEDFNYRPKKVCTDTDQVDEN